MLTEALHRSIIAVAHAPDACEDTRRSHQVSSKMGKLFQVGFVEFRFETLPKIPTATA
jgi:hypothetical protein